VLNQDVKAKDIEVGFISV